MFMVNVSEISHAHFDSKRQRYMCDTYIFIIHYYIEHIFGLCFNGIWFIVFDSIFSINDWPLFDLYHSVK